VDFEELRAIAARAVNPRQLSDCADAGGVAAAILSESGAVYTGVCIDTACSLGFCAEHAAIAAMVSAGESRILKVVAVREGGEVVPPCGRCREFIAQVHPDNMDAEVMVAPDRTATIRALLPDYWTECPPWRRRHKEAPGRHR